MIATTMATWMLVVQLQSRTQPMEARQWDRRYSLPSPERCEAYAEGAWANYNDHYKGTMTPWMQTFTTTCSATTAHHQYTWFITCDQSNICNTVKLKETRR